MCRGLVIDKQRGNILKIDRHKYVREAVHSFRALDAETRKATYNKEVVSFSEENFVNIDSASLLVGQAQLSLQVLRLLFLVSYVAVLCCDVYVLSCRGAAVCVPGGQPRVRDKTPAASR